LMGRHIGLCRTSHSDGNVPSDSEFSTWYPLHFADETYFGSPVEDQERNSLSSIGGFAHGVRATTTSATFNTSNLSMEDFGSAFIRTAGLGPYPSLMEKCNQAGRNHSIRLTQRYRYSLSRFGRLPCDGIDGWKALELTVVDFLAPRSFFLSGIPGPLRSNSRQHEENRLRATSSNSNWPKDDMVRK
jgi:hypothetical protein